MHSRIDKSITDSRFAQKDCQMNMSVTIEIDRDGSPVSKQPTEWFVCFVPGLQRQWWHRFAHLKHKHVFAMKTVGNGQWILFEPWWTRIMVTTLGIDEAARFLRWGSAGTVLRVRERIPGNGNQWRGWSNCSVLTALVLGRSYWTWTPHGLYERLLAEDGVEPVELAPFLEAKVTTMTRNMGEEALGDIATLKQLSPEAAFLELGRRVSRMIFSQKYLSLYRFAIAEVHSFPGAAKAFFRYGPQQTTSSVRELISYFFAAGHFQGCNQERAARAFLSMLRGNLHLQIAMGSTPSPDHRALELRTKSVVDIFLRGDTILHGSQARS
jgi:hypothetical protein